jgi:hypothetical protein
MTGLRLRGKIWGRSGDIYSITPSYQKKEKRFITLPSQAGLIWLSAEASQSALLHHGGFCNE